MTLDKAIEHAKLVASEQMMRAGKCTSYDKYCDKFSSCVKCAEEHEQLAQWIEELKEYKELEEKLSVMFGGDCKFSDVVENLERQITEPGKDHPVNARILTYEDAEKWNEYLELEEQGRLLKLPCRIGDDIYFIPSEVNYKLNILNNHCENNKVYRQKVEDFVLTRYGWYLRCDKDVEYGTGRVLLDKLFKETWFLTKSEAEAKVKEMEDEKDE